MIELSMDARVLLKSFFGFGPRTSVEVGGKHAQSILSDRARVAIDELIAKGFVTVEPVGRDGRQKFTGTGKEQPRMTLALMEEHGKWPATIPNPSRRPVSKG